MQPDLTPSEMRLDLQLHCLLAQDCEYGELHRKLMEKMQALWWVPCFQFNISSPNLKFDRSGIKAEEEGGCLESVTFF